MAKKQSATNTTAVRLFRVAQKYHQAANELFTLHPEDYTGPVSFLYFHTVELALKTFLSSYDKPLSKSHNLPRLYKDCIALGLKIAPYPQFELANIVESLAASNDKQGLRYVGPSGGSRAALSWTREVVDQLMKALETRIRAIADLDAPPGPLGSFILTIRPVRK